MKTSMRLNTRIASDVGHFMYLCGCFAALHCHSVCLCGHVSFYCGSFPWLFYVVFLQKQFFKMKYFPQR